MGKGEGNTLGVNGGGIPRPELRQLRELDVRQKKPAEPELRHQLISDNSPPTPLSSPRDLCQVATVFCPQTGQTLALNLSNRGYEGATDTGTQRQVRDPTASPIPLETRRLIGETPTYRGGPGRPQGRALAFPQGPERGVESFWSQTGRKYIRAPAASKLRRRDAGPRDATSERPSDEGTVKEGGRTLNGVQREARGDLQGSSPSMHGEKA